MSGILLFRVGAVQRLVDLTDAGKSHRPTRLDFLRKDGSVRPDVSEGAPSIWWVKDEGTYLMSSSRDAMALDGRPEVVYPTNVRKHQWERIRQICGGDDFCEPLPLEDVRLTVNRAIAAGDTLVVLQVEDNQVLLYSSRMMGS